MGFTLIEMLAVIAIIGILSTIAFFASQQFTARARDTRVINEFAQLQHALETYYSIHGKYPCGDNFLGGSTKYTEDSTVDGKSFLLGNVAIKTDVASHCKPYTKNYPPSIKTYDGGLQVDGIIGSNILEPWDHPNKSHKGYNPWTYAYEVSEDRQQYVIYTVLETNATAMRTDGGNCNNLYEAGNGRSNSDLTVTDSIAKVSICAYCKCPEGTSIPCPMKYWHEVNDPSTSPVDGTWSCPKDSYVDY
jgi:prepilin-type N-terminal cleavage/methylation domain-containing protein